MIALLIGTHGNLAKELLRSCEMIYGPGDNVTAVTFEPGESVEDLTHKYKQALQSLDTKDGVLFLTDLFGGSPYNVASGFAIHDENIGIVAGVNLPMVLEIVSSQSSSIPDAVEMAQVAGKTGIQAFERTLVHAENEEEL